MDGDDEESSSFPDLYRSFLFLICLFLAGDVLCGRFLRIVPSLVGQIAVGVIFGPQVLDWLPREWQTLGEIGLVLLLVQAGLEMDFDTLQKIGPRGGVMAVVGSILPISIGFLLSYTALGLEWESALAAGCSFGPTSAGIAMNVLEQCGVLKSQVGQLIVAIAIVDDIIALVVLSQLRALTGAEITPSSIAIPIVSAFLWLGLGGFTALYIMPSVFERLRHLERNYHLSSGHHNTRKDNKSEQEEDGGEQQQQQQQQQEADDDFVTTTPSSYNWYVGILLFALLPATYYSQASYLLGAFLAGLSACQESKAADAFNDQLAHIIQWLMRIFFGASIAFQIPILLFNDATIIGRGFLLSLSLLGKIMTGPLLTPVLNDNNNSGGRRWDGNHLRDCAIVGFSMAGEAEFAFLVASFGLEEGLLTEQVYASVVFAILLSTVVSPVLLRTTLALFPMRMPAVVVTQDKISNAGDDTAVQSDNADCLDGGSKTNNANDDDDDDGATKTMIDQQQHVENSSNSAMEASAYTRF
jgi:Kef-type K+ transport system membrane component KefB